MFVARENKEGREIVAAGGDSLNCCCRLSIIRHAKEMCPLPLRDDKLVLAYANPEACFVHIPDIFERNTILFHNGFEVGVEFSNPIYIFRRLPVRIKLLLKASLVSVALNKACSPLLSYN